MKKHLYLIALGISLFSSQAMPNDLDLCKELTKSSYKPCERLASSGNSDAMFGLGMLLLEGTGVEKNYAKSFSWMYKAAMKGQANAQVQVGQAYVNGQGVKKDYEEAYAWLLVAKENGNPVANKGITILDSNNVISQSRLNVVTQRANDLYAKTANKKGFKFNEAKQQEPISVVEYCDMVMPTTSGVIMLKKYKKPRSEAQQLMIGMTDQNSISMMNGLIDWVWNTDVEVDNMGTYIKNKCLSRSPEVSFLFP